MDNNDTRVIADEVGESSALSAEYLAEVRQQMVSASSPLPPIPKPEEMAEAKEKADGIRQQHLAKIMAMPIGDVEHESLSDYVSYGALATDSGVSDITETIEYVQTLGTQTRTGVNAWPLGRFGEVVDGQFKVFTDKKAINAAFFQSQKLPGIKVTIDPNHSQRLLKLSRTILGYDDEYMQKQVRSYRERANNLYDDYRSNLIEAHRARMEILKARNIVPNLQENVLRLLNEGFWRMPDVTASEIYLETVNDVILRHVDEDVGMDVTFNFGKILVAYIPGSCKVYGVTHPSNRVFTTIDGSNYIHPHVSTRSVCFGEIHEEASAAMIEGDVYRLGNVLAEVVTTYNDEDPMLHIGNWIAQFDPDYDGPNSHFEDSDE